MCIHETGDVAAAQQFWLEVTHASPEQFNKPSLKRHNPKTTRKNVGEDYHGCLRIDVHRSSASAEDRGLGHRQSWRIRR